MSSRISLMVALTALSLGASAPARADVRGRALPFQPLAFDNARPPAGLPKIEGKRLFGLRWRDKQGENVALFSRQRGRGRTSYGVAGHWVKIAVHHVVRARPGAPWRLLRLVRDMAQPCEFDITADFIAKGRGLSDLDHNGVAELTFAYRIGCRSDVSPIGLKLLILEAEKKYILRGLTRVRPAPHDTVGGTYRVDPAFRHAPAIFLSHAKQLWQQLADESVR